MARIVSIQCCMVCRPGGIGEEKGIRTGTAVVTGAGGVDDQPYKDDARRKHRRAFQVEVSLKEKARQAVDPRWPEVGVLLAGLLDGHRRDSSRSAGVPQLDFLPPETTGVVDLQQGDAHRREQADG